MDVRRRRAPQMPPIEVRPGGLDLRDVAEASRNYDAVRPAVRASSPTPRLCARYNGDAPAAAVIEAPAPAPAPVAAPAPPPGRYDRLMAPTTSARPATTWHRRRRGPAADPRAAAQAPCGRGARRRRRAGGSTAAATRRPPRGRSSTRPGCDRPADRPRDGPGCGT